MAFFLACIAALSLLVAAGFGISLAGTVATVHQQTVLYLGFGFSVLTGVCAAGFAAALTRLLDIKRAIKAQTPPKP